MSDNPFEEPGESKKRPTFLIVLCILSLLITGSNVIDGVSDLFTSSEELKKEFRSTIEQAEVQFEQFSGEQREKIQEVMNSLTPLMNKMLNNRVPMAITVLLLELLALFGVYRMFQLQKTGFKFYTTGKLLLLLVPFVFLGFGFLTIVWVIFALITTLIGIALYASQRKHMA